jgi:glycosyltransferase involved in cell wall biosynthesis
VTLSVTHYHRRPNPTDFSIERLFDDIRGSLPASIHVRKAVCRFRSRGLFPRLYNLVEAPFRQGDVNHITGDVHYLTLLLRKRRTVLTIHDCGSLERLHGWRRLVFRLMWLELPVRRASVVTTISNASREAVLESIRCDPNKVRVIHDCVSPAFTPCVRPFHAECPVILQIGTRPNKNLERVAEAIQGLPCHLTIVGPLTSSQRALLKNLGIRHTACQDLTHEEVVERYRDCDLVVFASMSEGFGLPVVEAQSMGRPVVASRIPVLEEIAGDAAVFVNPNDVVSIRAGILSVIQSPQLYEDLVGKGLRNAQRFKATAIAGHYADLYREVAASKRYSVKENGPSAADCAHHSVSKELLRMVARMLSGVGSSPI